MDLRLRLEAANEANKFHRTAAKDASPSFERGNQRQPLQFGESLHKNGALQEIKNMSPLKASKMRLSNSNPFMDPQGPGATKRLKMTSPFTSKPHGANVDPQKKSSGNVTKTRLKLISAQEQFDAPRQSLSEVQPQHLQPQLPDNGIPPEVREEIAKIEEAFPLLSSKYRLLDRIGEGTFSTVYKAEPLSDEFLYLMGENVYSSPEIKNRKTHRQAKKHYVALKRIYVTSSPQRILNELKLLFLLSGSPYVAPLLDAIREDDQIIAVLPYYEHIDYREFYRDLPLAGIKSYMYELFEALNYCHVRKVIHRDIKPTNFLYDPFKKRGILVDFGLAEMMKETDRETSDKTAFCPCKQGKRFQTAPTVQPIGVRKNDTRAGRRANRAGTRGFRAPEVLLKCPHQTTKIDIWSAGIILLTFLSRRFPFFNSRDDIDALVELTTIFGLTEMRNTAQLHGLGIETTLKTLSQTYTLTQIVHRCLRLEADKATFPDDSVCYESLSVFDTDGMIRYRTEDSELMRRRKREHIECFDVMEMCLKLDPKDRASAQEILRMPFFQKEDDGDMILLD